MIHVTEAARKRFLDIVAAEKREGYGLRVLVQGGGTARPEFALNFVAPDQVAADDVVQELEDFKIYVDPTSAPFLEGATVDFVETLSESGFKVEAPNAGLSKPSGPVADAVQKALDEKINPAVAGHGGWIRLVAVEDDTAYLQFGGGCQGCGMVNVTLKQGVERILFAEVPGLARVMDITDHAAGQNPYYQPAK